ncbi:unnamed protein product [Prorocentrum cordatum]|uniref:Uncharacterized protein n=1 Tax=Prorocentrum cordatum TaxID=2364126 RepID=A0ABN9PKD0_9DINO|nr:unnamed protein product [Polarella glacialis]
MIGRRTPVVSPPLGARTSWSTSPAFCRASTAWGQLTPRDETLLEQSVSECRADSVDRRLASLAAPGGRPPPGALRSPGGGGSSADPRRTCVELRQVMFTKPFVPLSARRPVLHAGQDGLQQRLARAGGGAARRPVLQVQGGHHIRRGERFRHKLLLRALVDGPGRDGAFRRRAVARLREVRAEVSPEGSERLPGFLHLRAQAQLPIRGPGDGGLPLWPLGGPGAAGGRLRRGLRRGVHARGAHGSGFRARGRGRAAGPPASGPRPPRGRASEDGAAGTVRPRPGRRGRAASRPGAAGVLRPRADPDSRGGVRRRGPEGARRGVPRVAGAVPAGGRLAGG